MEVSRVTSGAPPSAVAHIFQRPTRTEHDEPEKGFKQNPFQVRHVVLAKLFGRCGFRPSKE